MKALIPIVEPSSRSTQIARPPQRPNRRPLVDMWLEGKSPRTLRAYTSDAEDFAVFLDLPTKEQALQLLVSGTNGEANELVLSYRADMTDRRKLSSATVNRRLVTLRSFVTLARTLGSIQWPLDVKGVRQEAYRDTRGPGVDVAKKLLELAGQNPNPLEGKRDRAILAMMYGMALRRGEIQELELHHADISGKKLSILGKGRREREWLTMPSLVVTTLKSWLKVRGEGPLKSRAKLVADTSLFGVSYDSMRDVTKRYGDMLGVTVRPHGLRHTSITSALDKGNPQRAVQKFARHKNGNTTAKYDDNRQDFAGKVAESIVDDIEIED